MPTYDYACDGCGHAFEREQRISEDPVKKCPKCGKNKARRMITGGGGFILKGGGWYADLYSSTPSKKGGDADSGNAEGGGDSGAKAEKSAATDDKPAKTEKPAKADKPAKKSKGAATKD